LALREPAWQLSRMTTPAEKRKVFRKLHESGCFVIPNPWSPGTARYLEGLGFKALASTSSGYAHSQGFSDGALTLDQVLTHYREIASATSVPVNADFENCFAHEPAEVAINVKRCVETGVAGLSVEDYSNDDKTPIYDFDLAVARVKAARKAIDEVGGDVILTGRAEGVLHGRTDLADAIKRVRAFSDAGADCLYVPGIKTREQIVEVVKAVAPKPVNLLNHTTLGFTVKDITEMGVRRISVGGTLSRVAMDAFIKSARDIAENGRFDSFGGIVSNAELNKFFGDGP
jgi:2-methylisocitrate lyase-like PEP mutase family enzyme